MRIVSLLPSATDIVSSLGLVDDLVGRTHECDWPPELREVPVMTRDVLATGEMSEREIDRAVGASVHSGSSIYSLDHEALAAAKPDLILTQELCEVCAVSYNDVIASARIMDIGSKVVSLEPHTIDEILDNVLLVGELTGTPERAHRVVDDARRRLDDVARAVAASEPIRTVCIEWLDPIYVVGHWVPDQVSIAGGIELLGIPAKPSRIVAWEDVLAADPAAIVLLPCGLGMERATRDADLLRARPGWETLRAVREGRVWIVDGPAYFNRPGPRVVRGVEVLAYVLHGAGSVSQNEAINLES